jgi:crotonobetainyl-CoA:carnitine CoA-transferase CaiB-like acyl-CoA transferase
MKPLSGIKVLDFSRVLAGPLCTQTLGDLGAEIIKVESFGLGDETRGWPPFKEDKLSTVFLCVNRNKRSVVVDLKKPEGRALAHRLAAECDVAIESFGTGVAERLGIDAATLQAVNPRLVHCSISGFGRVGPLRQQGGYDVILQAFSGMMSLTGDEGGGYIRSPVSPIDQMTGVNALSGILAALIERDKTGKGGTVNASLFDTAIGLLRYNVQSFLERGYQPAKCGSSHEALCPYQAFEASNGPILIGVANDNLWRKFCALADLQDVVDHPKFRTNALRCDHRPETLAIVQEKVGQKTVEYWYEELSKIGVPVSPIYDLRQMLSHPHTKESGVMVGYDHPYVGHVESVAQPFILDGEAREAGAPPPMYGEHTDEILGGIGISAEEIARLKEAGVISGLRLSRT